MLIQLGVRRAARLDVTGASADRLPLRGRIPHIRIGQQSQYAAGAARGEVHQAGIGKQRGARAPDQTDRFLEATAKRVNIGQARGQYRFGNRVISRIKRMVGRAGGPHEDGIEAVRLLRPLRPAQDLFGVGLVIGNARADPQYPE